jgi:hypothetical protein
LDDPRLAARLAGAADTIRDESGMLLSGQEAALLEEHLAAARATVNRQEWDAAMAVGQALSEPEALALLRSLSPALDTPA